jgi:hypothetical protein
MDGSIKNGVFTYAETHLFERAAAITAERAASGGLPLLMMLPFVSCRGLCSPAAPPNLCITAACMLNERKALYICVV